MNATPRSRPLSPPVRFARARLVVHLLRGMLVLATVYRRTDAAGKRAHVQAWSQRLLALCGVTLRVHARGEVLSAGALVVSNHVSWLDIQVIDAWRPTPFVAKAEIAGWPLVGWLVKSAGTVFIRRERRSDARRVVEQLAGVLAADGLICVFAEGTTSDGREVAPFHANLMQAAIAAGVPVQPLCLMYEDARGRQARAPAFVGEMTFGESVRRVLAGAPLIAHLHVGEPLRDLPDRRAAATAAHAAVAAALAELQAGVEPMPGGEAVDAPIGKGAAQR